MSGKIEAYIDIASLYSYLAFTELVRDRSILESHGVTIDFIPVFLGAINVASGNKPPWVLPAKGRYLAFDSRRSAIRAGHPEMRGPKDLMTAGMTVLSLRALHYIKAHHPEPAFLAAFTHLYTCFWTPPNKDLTKPDVLAESLAAVPAAGGAGGNLFSADDVKAIMEGATSQPMKDSVKATTQEALDRGAFGAPWLWVTNADGKSEPFFGSDRFNHVYKFLGVPFQDVAVLPAGSKL